MHFATGGLTNGMPASLPQGTGHDCCCNCCVSVPLLLLAAATPFSACTAYGMNCDHAQQLLGGRRTCQVFTYMCRCFTYLTVNACGSTPYAGVCHCTASCYRAVLNRPVLPLPHTACCLLHPVLVPAVGPHMHVVGSGTRPMLHVMQP